MNHRPVLITLLLAACAPAFASGPPLPPDAPRADVERARDVADRHCLRETGTHLRPRADRARAGAAMRDRCTSQFGRAYTREDIERTGQADLAHALRMLDPSIY